MQHNADIFFYGTINFKKIKTLLMLGNHSDNLTPLARFRRSDLSGKTAFVLSTWFCSGLVPVASGTFGTLTAIPLVVLVNNLGAAYRVVAVLFVIGVALWSAEHTGNLLERKDPPEIVIDEVAGFVMAMAPLKLSWQAVGLTFFLFRFFDILKPFPISRLERLKGGIGIVMDDLLAGCYAYITARVILSFAALDAG